MSGLLTRARDRLARWIAPPEAPAPTATTRLVEAAGASGRIDRDEHLWQPLTGGHLDRQHLSVLGQTRMQDTACWLWEQNLLARQLIETPISFLIGRGVRVTVSDEDAQKRIDAWWRDPITDVPLRLPQWMRGLKIFGEQCWPVFVDPHSGHVRLGYLAPAAIATVVTDPQNPACPIGIVTVKDRKGRARRYRIIYAGPETMFAPRTAEIRATFTDGECFYWRKNTLPDSQRGRSDLLGALDWLDAYERYLYGELDRADFLRAFVWDVTLTGATQEDADARARQIRAPAPGEMRVHNESETWNAVSPKLEAYEAAAARLWRNHILSGAALPEHWFGGGGDVNRATAAEMDAPTMKALAQERDLWTEILRRCAAYVVWRSLDPAGVSPPDPHDFDPELEPVVEWPEMVERDLSRHASSLQHTSAAVGVALDRGLIGEELAVRIIASVAERLGVEIDPDEELRKAKAEATQRAEEDSFTDPPDDARGNDDAGESTAGA